MSHSRSCHTEETRTGAPDRPEERAQGVQQAVAVEVGGGIGREDMGQGPVQLESQINNK